VKRSKFAWVAPQIGQQNWLEDKYQIDCLYGHTKEKVLKVGAAVWQEKRKSSNFMQFPHPHLSASISEQTGAVLPAWGVSDLPRI